MMALMFALLMGVIARGIFRLTLGAQARQSLTRERARQAALSGIEYARSQLAKDSDWRGDATGTTISSDSMTVKESNGNVLGLLSYPDGGKAEFRIRFNYQDGSGGGDGMDDPALASRILSSVLSLNNLEKSSPADVPGQNSNFTVNPDLAPVDTVPGHAALLRVEGMAGPSVDGFSAATMQAQPSGYLDTVEVESVLKVEIKENATPAVMQSGGSMNMTTVDGVDISSLDDSHPSIRAKGDISVRTPDNEDGLLTMSDGKAYAQNGKINANYDSSKVNVLEEPNLSDLSTLTWEQVSKPTGAQSAKLPAGTYVLWPPMIVNGKPPENPNGEIHYFDMDYDQYLEQIHQPYIMNSMMPPAGLRGVTLSEKAPEIREGGILSSFPNAVKIKQDTMHISHDLVIAPTEKSKDFTVIPLFHGAMKMDEMQGVKGDEGWSQSAFKPSQGGNLQIQIENARVYSEGNMIFKGGSITARGATLIGEKNLDFNTPTLTVLPGENNISLYFKGDINLSSFSKTSQNYGQFKLNGIVYSWGDVNINVGDQSTALENWGNFGLVGSLVAYGEDPTTGKPGANQRGNINLTSKAASFVYDPTTILQLSTPQDLGEPVLITSVGSWIRL